MADVMKLPPLGDKAIEAYYDQTGIQEEGTFRVEKAQVRSFLVHRVSRGRIKTLSVILHIRRF